MVKRSQRAKNNFGRTIDQLISDYLEFRLAIHRKTRENALSSTLAEQFVRSVSLEWEYFLNEVFVSYTLEAPAQFLRKLRSNVDKSISDRYGIEASRRVTFSVSAPRSFYEIGGLLDPKNFNISFKSSSDLTAKASNHLPARVAQRFAFDRADAEFFDFLVCLRNYVSHKSRGSRERLIDSLDSLGEIENDVFKLGVTHSLNFHEYLKEEALDSMDRVQLIGHRLVEISEKL